MEIKTIIDTVRAAVDERNARRAALGARIREIAEQTLEVCALDSLAPENGGNPAWRLRRGEIEAVCSQWADGSYTHIGREAVLLIKVHGEQDRVVGEVPDCSYFDGHNHQNQRGPARLENEHIARPAPVALLRQIARELPAVVAAVLASREASCRLQAAEAAEALTQLGAAQ